MRRQGGKLANKTSGLLGVAIAALALSCAVDARANGTPAGTVVRNIASANFTVDGEQATIPSNPVATRINELLDLQLAPKSEGSIPVPFQLPSDFGVPFILTNSGNGTEAFLVTASVPEDEGLSLSVAIDVDGNGAYDPAVDIILSDGRTPAVAADKSLNLLVRFARAPAASGRILLAARSVTGSGTTAKLVPGEGDDGTDAIVGRTTASATFSEPFTLVDAPVIVQSEPASLTKTQTVDAPDGSNAAVQGATITYKLELRTTGTETLANAEIVDAIPAGTAYVPGSIRINGAATSDVTDSDAALFDGAAIHVAFGDISQPTTQVVTFQVTIL